MFDKIPSLKDFIIYLIPGILLSYFGLNIISHFSQEGNAFNSDKISNSSVLTFVGIIFSFLLGFLVSQFQIITSNFFLDRYNKKLRTIETASLSDDLKDELITQIQKTFNLANSDRNSLKKDPLILYVCLNYVKVNSNEESQNFINRSSYLSTFASTIPIPILLGSWNLFLEFNVSNCWTAWGLTLAAIIIIAFTNKIVINFRKEWINSVYRQFLILSLK